MRAQRDALAKHAVNVQLVFPVTLVDPNIRRAIGTIQEPQGNPTSQLTQGRTDRLAVFQNRIQKVKPERTGKLVNGLMQLLIELRASARQNKDFGTADKIRDDLAACSMTLEDRKEGTSWRLDK